MHDIVYESGFFWTEKPTKKLYAENGKKKIYENQIFSHYFRTRIFQTRRKCIFFFFLLFLRTITQPSFVVYIALHIMRTQYVLVCGEQMLISCLLTFV